VIFLTGHGDIPMSVRAIKAGAVDFLTKPVQAADLLQAVRAALAQAAGQAAELKTTSELRTKLARLTPREREVMEHIIAGKQNKEIAAELGTGEQTIKIHRMRLMQKLELKTVAGLVQLAARLGVHPGGRT
jgi:FixJ family two-component response regulator